MSRVEGGGVPIDPPLKASWNYFLFEVYRVKTEELMAWTVHIWLGNCFHLLD